MKATHFIFGLSIALFYSCYETEGITTFYNDDTLTKEMIATTQMAGEMQYAVNSTTTLNLMDSDYFKRYAECLIDLEVTAIEIKVLDYYDGLENAQVSLGNTVLTNCTNNNQTTITIKDKEMLENISNEWLKFLDLPLEFSGTCNSQASFRVATKVTFKGTFVN